MSKESQQEPSARLVPDLKAPSGQAGLGFAALASLLLGVYSLSMAPGYTFEDTSLFAAACYTLGVAHPPGYPLQVLTCAPFSWLAEWAGWHPAKGAAFASVFAAVLACVLLAKLAYGLCNNAAAACAACAACAFTPIFWAQAIIPEAYALNCLLTIAALLAADSYCRKPMVAKLYIFSLLCGLGLANHWPIFVLNIPLLALWLAPAYRSVMSLLTNVRVAVICVLLFLGGLTPYLHLLWLSSDAAVFLGADLPADFFAYVMRDQFSQFDQAAQHPRWDERLHNAGLAVLAMARQYTWLGALAGAGALVLAKKLGTVRVLALLWGLLSCTFVLALARPYLATSEVSATIFSTYSLTALAVFSLLLALLLARLFRANFIPKLAQWPLAAALAATMIGLNWSGAYRGQDDLAMRYAAVAAAEISANSLLLVGSGNEDFPLVYDRYFDRSAQTHYRVENFQNFLDRRGLQPGIDELATYLADETEPVYLSVTVPTSERQIVYKGAYHMWATQSTAGQLSDSARDLLRKAAVLRSESNNLWTREFADQLIFEFMLRSGPLDQSNAKAWSAQDIILAQELADTPAGRYAAFLHANATSAGIAGNLAQVETQLAQLGELRQYPLRWRVEIMYLHATAQLSTGRTDEAIATLEEALRIYSAAQNFRVLGALLALHAQRGSFQNYAYLRRRYPALSIAGLAGYDAQCQSNLGRSCT